jgi:hypothetical protein
MQGGEVPQCDSPFHMSCLDPPLTSIPPGEWFCPDCVAEAEDYTDDEDDEVRADVKPTMAGGTRGRAGAAGVVDGKEDDDEGVVVVRGGKGRNGSVAVAVAVTASGKGRKRQVEEDAPSGKKGELALWLGWDFRRG